MAFAFLVHAAAGSADAVTATTSGIDTTGANLLVACVSSFAGIQSISDSVGGNSNTWTPLTQVGGGAYSGRLFWCVPTFVGSGHTFTGTSSFPAIAVAAFSGAAASPYDQESFGDGVAQPGSITPAEDNELFVAGFSGAGTGTGATVDQSFIPSTSDSTWGVDQSGNNVAVALAYLIETSAAAKNPTWGGPISNNRSSMATFKAAATAAAALPRPPIIIGQSVKNSVSY